jgi:zinc/manganese transport system substrate-binding protein
MTASSCLAGSTAHDLTSNDNSPSLAPGDIVADLIHKMAGDNPRLRYDPATMPAHAKALTAVLAERDPGNKPNCDRRPAASLHPLDTKIAELRSKFAGGPVTAMEPVFGYMTTSCAHRMLPPPRTTSGNTKCVCSSPTVRQSNAAAQCMVRIAKQVKIPVVGVTETEPAGTVPSQKRCKFEVV